MRDFTRRGGIFSSLQPSYGERKNGSRLRVEALETRQLMSATATPGVESLGVTSPVPYGLTPSQVRHAYGFDQVTFKNGTVQGNGAGQTIAIIDAYGDPNIANDLATFDATFHIGNPPGFRVVNQNGGTALPAANSTWALETALDVEWAHAIAPAASILLVQANSSNLGDLLTAVNYARNAPGVSVISMSWGSTEFNGEASLDTFFTTPTGHTGVTFVGSAGDAGAPGLWPALSSNVLAVGGTTLTLGAGSTYGHETGWGDSGGGPSRYESEPSYQRGLQSTGARTGPDVSYDANPSTGFAVYDSLATGGRSGWFEVGGTSAGAPQWAALVSIADQGRALSGLATLGGVQSQIYSLPSSDFHDVNSGNNGYAAGNGYDLVTGRGSPVANLVIAGLVGNPPTTVASSHPQTTFVGPINYFNLYNLDSTGSGTNGGDSAGEVEVDLTQVAQQTGRGGLLVFNSLVNWTPGTQGSGGMPALVASLQPNSLADSLPAARTLLSSSNSAPGNHAGDIADNLRLGTPVSQGSAHQVAGAASLTAAAAGSRVPAVAVSPGTGSAADVVEMLEAVWSGAEYQFDLDATETRDASVSSAAAVETIDHQSSSLGLVLAGLAIGWAQWTARKNADESDRSLRRVLANSISTGS